MMQHKGMVHVHIVGEEITKEKIIATKMYEDI